MTLEQFRAVIRGYEDHLFDLECLAVHTGYWAGYYSNTKRPKTLKSVLEILYKNHLQSKNRKQASTKVDKPEVDVDQFLKREARFNQFRNSRR